MKRALLIAGGTLGGLGAVMAITPPQLGSNQALDLGSATTASTPAATVAKSAPAPTQPTAKATTKTSTSSKPVATKKAAATQSAAKATAAASASASATTAATTAAAPAAKGVTGVFVGPTVDVSYGNVQVQITVKDGQITDAKALQAPSGRNRGYTERSVPILRERTLTAQSGDIQGTSVASYTSYGWIKSLQGALAKAGL